MCTKFDGKRKLLQFLYIGVALSILGLFGCATTAKQVEKGEKVAPARVEAVHVRSVDPTRTVLEITSSRTVPFTTFRLMDPPRVIMDVQAEPDEQVLQTRQVNDANVSRVSVEKNGSKANTTRIVVLLARAVDYDVAKKQNTLVLSLNAKETPENSQQTNTTVQEPAKAPETTNAETAPAATEQPRIFFTPTKKALTQVLGVDFGMLGQGKSRLTITTSRKGRYDLVRTGAKSIGLNLKDASIPPLLMRRLDASYFKGAVNRVKANYFPAEKRVSLNIALRQMVPFHIDQSDSAIYIDFGKTDVKPPATDLVPIALREPTTSSEILNSRSIVRKMDSLGGSTNFRGRQVMRRRYTGTRMTMDFVNADVTNILRLIGEVSNLNIIWGPDVKGTVSMRLRNVPWDQALDLVLANNNLGMRREGNVIWVTTASRLAKVEAEEQHKRDEAEAEREKRLKAKIAIKAQEPLITAYLTINYADADAIKNLIANTVKGPRGRLTVDTASKTIIMTDTAADIAAAKKLVARQDKPTKQVMIEARIVEADTSFSRELGVDWNGSYQTSHNPWGGTTGGTYTYNFSTNLGIPTLVSTASTAGVSFANTAATKLLNAKLALGETEGEVKTLSAPKIITRDTVKATIQQGTKLVLPAGTDANGNLTYKMTDATLKLEVTPKITPNNKVIMNISVSDDSPDYADARGDFVPINTKSAKTEMMVATGDTVVIGGIYKETKNSSLSGTPWLMRVPILGWLFKDKSINTSRTELLIFLTPTVVSTPG